MLVVSDLDDVFLPKPNDLLVNLTEARAGLEALLGRLSDMFQETHNVGSALGSALQAGFKMLSNIGGKLIVCSASLPTLGIGALKNREDPKMLGTTKVRRPTIAYRAFIKLAIGIIAPSSRGCVL